MNRSGTPRPRARPGAAHARSARLAVGGDVPDHRLGDAPDGKLSPLGGCRAKLLVSARPAVMVRGVASVGDRSLLPPAPHAPAPIRAPPRLRPPLP
jgi:hypothetical protein